MPSLPHQASAQVGIRRHYRVAPDKVWRAWTDPKALSEWFSPGSTTASTTAEIDLSVGGRYRIAFVAPDGERHEATGVYQEVVPQRRLVFSWSWKSTPERVSRISIELTPVAGGTELSFVHDRFFDAQARDNHERGWQLFFTNLDHHLEA